MISVRVFNYISEKSFGRNISLRLHLRLGLRLRTLVNMGTAFYRGRENIYESSSALSLLLFIYKAYTGNSNNYHNMTE